MTYEPTQLWVYAGRGDNYVPSLKPIRVVSVPIGDNTTSFTNNYSTCSDIPRAESELEVSVVYPCCRPAEIKARSTDSAKVLNLALNACKRL